MVVGDDGGAGGEEGKGAECILVQNCAKFHYNKSKTINSNVFHVI